MSETLPHQPEKPSKAVPLADSKTTPAVQQAAGALTHETTTSIRTNLTSEGRLDILEEKPINEDTLKDLRNSLNKPPEVLELMANLQALAQAKGKDAEAEADLVRKNVEGLTRVSQIFLEKAQAECAMADMDLVKTRVLIHLAYNNAKALSAGRHNNSAALDALKAWQATLITGHPEAAKKLVQSYERTIAEGAAAEKPDFIWLKQWIDLCTGFAPELAPALMEKFHAAAERRCDFLIAKIEDELVREKPDMSMVTTTIGYPPNYYVHLKQGSTVPDRVQALQQRVAALQQK